MNDVTFLKVTKIAMWVFMAFAAYHLLWTHDLMLAAIDLWIALLAMLLAFAVEDKIKKHEK